MRTKKLIAAILMDISLCFCFAFLILASATHLPSILGVGTPLFFLLTAFGFLSACFAFVVSAGLFIEAQEEGNHES